MAQIASRHTLYYDLLDAFKQKGCPICRLGKLTVSRYLDILAYENVNDPGVRGKLRAAHGFCSYHAYQFLDEVRDLLGVGIIYRDVVNSTVLALSERHALGASWQGLSPIQNGRSIPGGDHALASILAPTGPCPACQELDGSVTSRLHVLLRHLSESDFRAAYDASAGLCYPHFLKGLAEVGDASQLTALVDSQQAHLERAGSCDGPIAALGSVGECFGQPGAVSIPDARTVAPTRAWPGCDSPNRPGVDHLDPDRCPVCEVIAPDIDRSVEELARSIATDEDAAGQIGTLCNRHAWQVARTGAGDLAPLLHSLKTLRQMELARTSTELLIDASLSGGLKIPGRQPWAYRVARQVIRRLETNRHCPLCERQSEIELAALGSYLAPSAPSPDASRVHVDGNGNSDRAASEESATATLCLPHFVQSCYLPLPPRERAELARRQSAGWTTLVAELQEYLRKQDYRFRDEPRGHEQTSPYRAVEQMAGRKGIR